MRNIRRAAVTGLMAAWLAPLSAFADPGCTRARSIQALVEEQRPAPVAEDAARPEALREARRRLLRREG